MTAGDPRALGQLLRVRRERLTPQDVGLPPGTRRRTSGLRREEVAALASVSTTYYTFLEQGRPVRPSEQVLDALAAALRMTPAERRYLRTLAHGPDATAADSTAPGTGPSPPPALEQVSPSVLDLVQRLEPYPTLVKGRRWDVLAANPAARELFGDWSGGGEGNLVRWMFTSERAREVYLEWEPEARAMLGRFRLAAARHPDDPRLARLIAGLTRESPHVRDWWPAHDVTPIGGEGTKKLRHPRLGPVEYAHVVLHVADHPDHVLVTYSAAPGEADPPPGVAGAPVRSISMLCLTDLAGCDVPGRQDGRFRHRRAVEHCPRVRPRDGRAILRPGGLGP
jgi:transcriptional regulator with XRE-family HTH domain